MAKKADMSRNAKEYYECYAADRGYDITVWGDSPCLMMKRKYGQPEERVIPLRVGCNLNWFIEQCKELCDEK